MIQHKRYIVVIRHGQRIDETCPESVNGNEAEYWDTGLTEKGKLDSHHTGYKLMEYLHQQGIVDQLVEQCVPSQEHSPDLHLPNIQLMSSLFYRCLQTTQFLKRGMLDYLEGSLKESDTSSQQNSRVRTVFEQLAKQLGSSRTLVEDACSEKIAKLPVSSLHNLRLLKTPIETTSEFGSLDLVINSSFAYGDKDIDLILLREFRTNMDIIDVCQQFYSKLSLKLFADNIDVMVVVAHGMYVKTLMWDLQVDMNVSMKTVPYSSCSVVELTHETIISSNEQPSMKRRPLLINMLL